VNGNTTLQVGELEIGLAVSAIGSADEVEKDVELGDGEQGPIAKGPVERSVIEADQANFAYIGVTHP
jgi:hypothetical protein